MVQSGMFYIYSGDTLDLNFSLNMPQLKMHYTSVYTLCKDSEFSVTTFALNIVGVKRIGSLIFRSTHFETIRRRKLPWCPHKHPQHTIYPIFTSHPHWYTRTICIHASSDSLFHAAIEIMHTWILCNAKYRHISDTN